MLHLVTFGGLALEAVNEAVAPRLSAQRLAILAVLAAEGDRRVTRERLTGLFWPDSDEERSRHSLRQALYALRQELGREVVRSNVVLELDPSSITSDVSEFRSALTRGDLARAAMLVRGPFLDGFYLPSAAPFQRWVEEERARLHLVATTTLLSLASDASASNDLSAAIPWWRQLTTLDPLSGRFAVGLIKALAARGDRAEALAFARTHAALVQRELETEPDAEVRRLEASLRATPFATNASPLTDVSADESSRAAPSGDVVDGRRNRAPSWTRSRRLTPVALSVVAIGVAVVLGRNLGWRITDSADASSPPSAASVVAGSRDDVTTRSATAYRLYQEGIRAYYELDTQTAGRLMKAALRDDSTFAMAAYYDAKVAEHSDLLPATTRALALAERASERERLRITADLLVRTNSPRAAAVAETLATRYPTSPRAFSILARARGAVGDWAGAVEAFERTLAIDSLVPDVGATCVICEDFAGLAELYEWWDSLPAAARTGERSVRARPDSPQGWYHIMWAAAKAGDSVGARAAFRRYTELHSGATQRSHEIRMNLMLESYGNLERDLRPLLESPKLGESLDARWWYLIGLRNQGRLRDAKRFLETGTLPGLPAPAVVPHPYDEINDGLIALEMGDVAKAVTVFTRRRHGVENGALAPGILARAMAWSGTLAGMAMAAAGDTAAVVRMADSVEYWGRRSLFGRDQKLHHYLRGMVHAAAGRDEEAIRAFRRAMFSTTLGLTRVNYELARVLLRQGRPREAVEVLEPALRGDVDAANLYITRPDLHELTAQAYDRLGEPDRAAVHYRAIVRAWANADETFHSRRQAARAWLARYDR